jgi:hypothetical protein
MISRKPLYPIALMGALSLLADVPAQEKASDPPKPATANQEEKKEEPKRDPKSLEYEKAIKDLVKVDGHLTFYLRKKEILWEVPESRLGQLLLAQATFSSGGGGGNLQAGDPLDYPIDVFRVERQDENLHLIRPNTRFRWDPKNPLALPSQRSFPEAYLATFRIEQTDPEKKLLLVNLTNFFNGDVFRVGEVVNTAMRGQWMLDSNRSGPEKVLSFPKNAIVRMHLNYNSARGMQASSLNDLIAALLGDSTQLEDRRNFPLRVSYNLWFREPSDYTPRLSDPRVGYFTSDFYSVDRFNERDRTVRYINRWNLKKKDPSAALSEPVKPIVWTLDPSIPPVYRPSVREGILRWNKAFEKIGFKNAIQVQDAPKDPDYDHADGRYNVIRWAMTRNEGYAVAQARNDPFTGEILNAGVTLDANIPNFAFDEQADFAAPGKDAIERFQRALLRNPEARATGEEILFGDARRKALDELLHNVGVRRHDCCYAHGLAREASFAWAGLEAVGLGKTAREQYVHQFIADVVSHEIGHTLGLRHNFVASTWQSPTQMEDSGAAGLPYSASVMDYNPVNTMAVLKGKGGFYMTDLGPYDLWAIRYGYEPIPAEAPEDEKWALSRIAAQADRPGHAYNTDEDADAYDPTVVRFDGSSDPLAYSEANLIVARRVLKFALEQLPRPGDSWDRRTNLILSSFNRIFREGRLSARFIGGLVKRRFKAGDSPKPILSPVAAEDQRRALRLIVDHCLRAEAFRLPVEARLNLGYDPESTRGADFRASLRSQWAMQQQMLVGMLLSADRLDNIAENTFRLEGSGKPVYTLSEHYAGVVGATFSELRAGTPIPTLRRDLQRTVLQALVTQATSRTGMLNNDARAIAGLHLREVGHMVRGRLGKAKDLDADTVAHLRSMQKEIEEALKTD